MIVLRVFDYEMGLLEATGTVFNFLSVWLISRKSFWGWPVGLVASALFGVLFYQIRLYADVFEQIYYFLSTFYGWWVWGKRPMEEAPFRFSERSGLAIGIAVTISLTGLFASTVSRFHLWWPSVFPEPASFVFADSLTTAMSFTAMILMAWRRVESWIYWMIVNVLSVGLYFVKDVWFISLLYAIFFLLAVKGYRSWRVSESLHSHS